MIFIHRYCHIEGSIAQGDGGSVDAWRVDTGAGVHTFFLRGKHKDEQKNQDDGEADKKRRVDQFFCFYDNNFCFCTQKKQSFRYIILINLILRQRIYD